MSREHISQVMDEIVEEFAFFDDWDDKYRLLIDYGRRLPVPAEDLCTPAYKVSGCQSQLWIKAVPRAEGEAVCLDLYAMSDAAIVSGLVALLLRIYSGRSASEILDSPPRFIKDIGLDTYLSPSRGNGLQLMIQRIFDLARSAQKPE